MSPVADRALENAPPPEHSCGTCPRCGSPLVSVLIWSGPEGYKPAVFCWSTIKPDPTCGYRETPRPPAECDRRAA